MVARTNVRFWMVIAQKRLTIKGAQAAPKLSMIPPDAAHYPRCLRVRAPCRIGKMHDANASCTVFTMSPGIQLKSGLGNSYPSRQLGRKH